MRVSKKDWLWLIESVLTFVGFLPVNMERYEEIGAP